MANSASAIEVAEADGRELGFPPAYFLRAPCAAGEGGAAGVEEFKNFAGSGCQLFWVMLIYC
jgi:hypothetical protein